ncbi:MAG: hypothetical protein HYY06_02360 [Deltaproteobacteria bacterium]|nr:hypothetical protein [Deltaproteobacteria bacterium]
MIIRSWRSAARRGIAYEILALLLAFASSSCKRAAGGDDDSGDGDADTDSDTDTDADSDADAAQEACDDVASAVADAAADCYLDRGDVFDAFTVGCLLAVGVRDETELYQECMPSISAATCASLFPLDSSCEDQIVLPEEDRDRILEDMQARIEAAVRGRAEAGCEAMADAYGRAGERACDGSYAEWRQSFEDSAPDGDCGNVLDLRDAVELFEECVPSFADMTCDQLQTGPLDSSCEGQLRVAD